MDVILLQAFVATAQYGSASEAAKSLGYSSSGLSRQLHALESRLGAQLLCQTGGRLVPTERGEAVLPLAESIVALANAMEVTLKQHRRGPDAMPARRRPGR